MPRLLLLVPTATYRAGAFVRAAQRLDIDITLASEKPNSLSKYHPVDLVTLDFADPTGSAKEMRSFAKRHPIKAVIGVDDQVTLAASAIGAALELPHNPIDSAYATLNKRAMRERLAGADVPVPRFRALTIDEVDDRVASAVTYPCVLKPLMMAASRGVIRVNTPEDFVRTFRKVATIVQSPDAPQDLESRGYLLVEQYVPGWEVAIEGILTNGRLHVFAIFDKPDPLEGPYFPETIYVTPSRHPQSVQRKIMSMTEDGARAVGLRHGPIHAELRGQADQLWFIEIASRSIGGYCSKVLRFEGGLSLEDVIIRHALESEHFRLPDREDRAAGVMMLQAPTEGRFKEVLGLDRARAIDGIDEVIVSSHRDQALTPLPEGFLYLGFVFARAQGTAEVEGILRTAYDELEFVIEAT
jgi:biotin carboxylase